jgi:lipopolysaccharide transport system ATP-binding protein
MSDSVISVENLGKKYIIGHQKQESYTALRDVVANGAKSLLRPFRWGNLPLADPSSEEFWALKDVSFEIKQGDRVGIIGRNGAGKSTLLKILSRITEPTKGSIRIKGRVASLLEVGTGFHPELTGRENISLNGAILGMSKAEIVRKFDEIVAFAEVEKFLDTPVKRYSSGMYVRLAFSVDEVLAVGDTQFQEKCLGKMEDVAKGGRTVLFVSHNIGAIKALCDRGIFLNQGNMLAQGSINEVIQSYMQRKSSLRREYIRLGNSEKPCFARITTFQTHDYIDCFQIEHPIEIQFELETYGMRGLAVGIAINNSQGLCVHHSSDEFNTGQYDGSALKRKCIIPPHILAPGKYYVDVFLGKRNIELFDQVIDALVFEVDFSGAMADKTTAKDWKGVCSPGALIWS